MKVHVSKGNNKMGRVWNVSLMPGFSCIPNAPCYRDCYARKFLFRKEVNIAWHENTDLACYYRGEFFSQILETLDRAKNKPRFFRWHVAGDIPDQDYLKSMYYLADEFPDIQFWAFTKRYHLDYSGLPSNLCIIFSAWPGYPLPSTLQGRPIAWMQDGTEDRIPPDAIECPGNCESCGMCAQLDKIGKHVVFHKH